MPFFAPVIVLLGAASWMTTPTAREPDWIARHEGFVAEAKNGGIDVLFLGDSITDGWRHAGSAPWKRTFAPLRAANFGIGGDGTHNVLWRIAHGELDGVQPKVVVLLIGTNNVPWAVANETKQRAVELVSEGVSAVVDAIAQHLPRTRILQLAIFPRGDHAADVSACIAAVNERLKARAGGRVTWLDLSHLWLEDGRVAKALMPDLLHPNELGYERWAKALAPVVKELLAKP